jgi:hypothetical protein
MVYAYTDLMDRNRSAIVWELIKNSVGLYFIVTQYDWFGASQYLPRSGIMIFAYFYFFFSTIVTAWFVYKHTNEDKQLASADSSVQYLPSLSQ